MPRAALTVAEVFRRYGDTFRAQAGTALSTAQRRVMTTIEQCRTAALGGHVEQCDRCGHRRVWYNSCRNRHCPTCRSLARAPWLEQRRADLLPTEYFHVVFTVPPAVAEIPLFPRHPPGSLAECEGPCQVLVLRRCAGCTTGKLRICR